MATLQDNPSLVPDAVQEWTRELNISELGRVGYLNINMTLWNESSTAVPNVIAGSIIEINNSIYVETINVALNVTGQTVDAVNWVIYEVSGSVATAYLKPTAPTASDYDVDKGGFYNGSGYRWTGQYMFVSPAGTAYSNKGILDYANGAMLKYRIDDEADDFVIDSKLDVKETLNVDGDTTLGGTITVDNLTLPSLTTSSSVVTSVNTDGEIYVLFRGVLDIILSMTHVSGSSSTSTLYLEKFVNSSWENVGAVAIAGPTSGSISRIYSLYSSGTNLRVRLESPVFVVTTSITIMKN